MSPAVVPIFAQVLVNGTAPFLVDDPVEIIAFTVFGQSMDVRQCDDSASAPAALTTGSSKSGGGSPVAFNLRFAEGFASAFRIRLSSPPHNALGQIFNDESGVTLSPGDPTGQATQGTRLVARLDGIPDGVQVYVSTGAFDTGRASSASISAVLTASTAAGAGPLGPLPSSAMGFCPSTGATAPLAPIPVTGGVATATWEVTASDVLAIEKLSFAVALVPDHPVSASLLASGNFGPMQFPGVPNPSVPAFADLINSQSAPSKSGLTFIALAGGSDPAPQSLGITTAGREPISFTAAASTEDGASWLKINPANGASDSTTVSAITVLASAAALSPGVYYGKIDVTAVSSRPARGLPLVIPNPDRFATVVLEAIDPAQNIGPIVTPSGALFSPASTSAAAVLTNLGASPISFTTFVTAPWLQVFPAAGTIPANGSLVADVLAITTGVTPGTTYSGSVKFSFPGGLVRSFDARLLLPAGPAGLTSSIPAARARPRSLDSPAGCTPSVLEPAFELVGQTPSQPAGWPVSVVTQVADDCNNPMVTGSVTLSFNSGDAPLPMIPQADGSWSATWVPASSQTDVTITASAATPPPGIQGSATYNTGVAANADPPVVSSISSVGGNPAGGPLAPGHLIVITGQNLTANPQKAVGPSLPTSLGGVSVLASGQLLPLLETAAGQVTAILPFTLTVNSNYDLILVDGVKISGIATVNVVPAQPSVLLAGDGTSQGQIVVMPGGNLANPSSPAHAGDTIEIQAVGLGTAAQGQDQYFLDASAGAPDGPPASVLPLRAVSLTIGGMAAGITYAELIPGSIGIYRIGATVPPVPAGDNVPVILVAGGAPSAPVTMSVH